MGTISGRMDHTHWNELVAFSLWSLMYWHSLCCKGANQVLPGEKNRKSRFYGFGRSRLNPPTADVTEDDEEELVMYIF